MKFNNADNRIFGEEKQYFLCKRISRVTELILAALIFHLSERVWEPSSVFLTVPTLLARPRCTKERGERRSEFRDGESGPKINFRREDTRGYNDCKSAVLTRAGLTSPRSFSLSVGALMCSQSDAVLCPEETRGREPVLRRGSVLRRGLVPRQAR